MKKIIMAIILACLLCILFLTKKQTIQLVPGINGKVPDVYKAYFFPTRERYVIPLVPQKTTAELFEEEDLENSHFLIHTKYLFGIFEGRHTESIDGIVQDKREISLE